MKVFAILFAITATAANAAQCDLSKLAELPSSPLVSTCAKETTYLPPARPTDAQVAAICKSSACQQLLNYVGGLGLGDCEIGTVSLKKDILDRVKNGCSSATTTSPSSTTPAPTTSTPSSTTKSPSSTTPAPSTTTTAPATSTPATSSSGSSAAAGTAGSSMSMEGDSYETTSGSEDYSIEQTDEASSTGSDVEEVTTTPVPAASSNAIATVVATAAASVVALIAAVLV